MAGALARAHSASTYRAVAVLVRTRAPTVPPTRLPLPRPLCSYLIPGPQPPNTSSAHPVSPAGRSRFDRLVGRAAAAAAEARAAGLTSRAFTPAGAAVGVGPTDAAGLVDQLSLGPGGLSNTTIFRDTLLVRVCACTHTGRTRACARSGGRCVRAAPADTALSPPRTRAAAALQMTQVAQASCVKTEGELYRRAQDDCAGKDGCTMGFLYWMAADSVGAYATKGGIEQTGRAKVLHHVAKDFFAPVLVSPFYSTTDPARALGVTLSVHPPAAGPLAGTLVITAWSWADGRLGSLTLPYAAPRPTGSTPAYNGSLPRVLNATGCPAPSACILLVDAFNGTERVASNFLWPAPPKNVTTMRDPGLAVADVVADPGACATCFAVTYTVARPPAASVWLESLLEGRWSENGGIVVDASRTVSFIAAAPATAGQVAASLTIASLCDTAAYGPECGLGPLAGG